MSDSLYDVLERGVKAIKEHPELAPVSSISMTEDGIYVTPYIITAPVTALLTWHDAMTEVTREAQRAEHKGFSWTRITVHGLLGEVPVSAVVTSVRDLPTARSRPSIADLRRVAEQEDVTA